MIKDDIVEKASDSQVIGTSSKVEESIKDGPTTPLVALKLMHVMEVV